MHELHIRILTEQGDRFASTSVMFSNEQQTWARAVLAARDLYVKIHEQMLAAEGRAQIADEVGAADAAGGGVQNQSANPPGMEGEAAGDVLSGVQGQVAAA